MFEALDDDPQARDKYSETAMAGKRNEYVAPKQLEALFKRHYEEHPEPDFPNVLVEDRVVGDEQDRRRVGRRFILWHYLNDLNTDF